METLAVLETLAARPLVRRLTDVCHGSLRGASHGATRSTFGAQRASRPPASPCARTPATRASDWITISTASAPLRTISAACRCEATKRSGPNTGNPLSPISTTSTWPGTIPYFAFSSGTTSGATKYIPLSRQMLASNQKAAPDESVAVPGGSSRHTAVHGATFLPRRQHGSTCALGRAVKALHRRTILAGDLSGITVREASALLRPFTFPPEELALVSDWDEKMRLLAERGGGSADHHAQRRAFVAAGPCSTASNRKPAANASPTSGRTCGS